MAGRSFPQRFALLHSRLRWRLCIRKELRRRHNWFENFLRHRPLSGWMRYLITFTCYGHRLHGDPHGSVDREHRLYGTPYAPSSPSRLAYVRALTRELAFELDGRQRRVVLQGLREAALCRTWRLWAAHVRPSHVHGVVEAECPPEEVLRALKAYAIRQLKRLPGGPGRTRHWARHGSTVWLWKDRDFHDALVYVADRQGAPMELYVDPAW